MLLDDELEALDRAMREHLLVSVRYNLGQSILAPYATYTSRGERYLRAITLARDGRELKALKLGTFKLSGLSNLMLTEAKFSAGGLFRQAQAAEAGGKSRGRS